MRRYELDWLRLILFGLLVPYHAALGFVSYGADVYGFVNDQLGGVWLELALDFSHSWRIFALFMISGVGTWFAARRRPDAAFVRSRALRLGLPLIGWILFGAVATVVTPWGAAAFFPFTVHGISWWPLNLVDFWHLWFLKNLLIYTMMAVPILARPRLLMLDRASPRLAVLAIAGGMALFNMLAEPVAEKVLRLNGDDLYNLMGFLFGLWIGANAAKVLDWAARWWWGFLLAGLASYPLTLAFQLGYYQVFSADPSLLERYSNVMYLGWHAVRPVNALIWGITVFGLAARVLNHPSALLARLNRLVFPLYVFHMPITLVGIGIAAQTRAAWPVEMGLIIVGTFALSLLLAMGAERLGRFAYFFGATPLAK